MPITVQTAHVTDQQAGRVDHVIRALTGLSHSKLRGLLDHGCVTVNGESCAEPGQQVHPGDRVDVRYDPGQGYREKKHARTDPALAIVFEDEHLLVIDKPAKMLTVATDNGEPNTLAAHLTRYLQQTNRRARALVVHRLDQGVSGLLVFAKSSPILQALQDQFKQRKPERVYIAIVDGVLAEPAGSFRSYLATGQNLDRYSTRHADDGQLAITHYQVQKRLNGATVVEVRLETGRRNQIRVHFAEAGHPVLGDARYGPAKAARIEWPPNRLALHAASLAFVHPATGESMRFQSEIPAPMRRLIGK
jgi:23S rRNA pseudouridine1911/1915/1917 synthase